MLKPKLRWIFGFFLVLFSIYFSIKVRKIIFPFIVGAVIAYLLNPAVNWLEKKGLRRSGAIAVIYIWIVTLLALSLFLLLPTFYLELGKLAIILPERLAVINDYIQNGNKVSSQGGLPAEVSGLINKKLMEGQSFLIGWLEGFLENLPGLFASIGLLILSPITAIYFLKDWRKMIDGVIKLVPGRKRGEWSKLLQEIDYIIQRYIQGNLIDALIVGLLIGIGIKLIGMEYALLIGVICGITNLIPYFGPVLGTVPSVLLALSKSPVMALKVVIVIFIIQQIDSNIINPRLMSNKVGLHPLWVIFALLAGGELGGLLGMLVAIPLAAILRIIFRDIYYYVVSPRDLKTTKN